jgi:cell division septum initiation protein DivIVA
MKILPSFEEFINENLRPDQIEQAAKDLAHSMANHTQSKNDDGSFSDEQILKAFKYFPNLKYAKGAQANEIVKKAQAILNESLNESSIEELDKLLASHDWYYMMSDDDRAYSKGSQEEAKIKKLIDQLGDEGREHYKNVFVKHFPNAKK